MLLWCLFRSTKCYLVVSNCKLISKAGGKRVRRIKQDKTPKNSLEGTGKCKKFMMARSKTVCAAMSGSKTDTILPNNPFTVLSKIQKYINMIHGETILKVLPKNTPNQL